MSVSEAAVSNTGRIDSASVNQAGRSTPKQRLHSLPLLNLEQGRAAVLAYFENTWALTEQLFSSLASEEAFYARPYHRMRHPLIFYYTHPVCFYINKLLVSGLIDAPVNQEYELLFEAGVDEMNWDDLHEGEQDAWPSLHAVRAYREQVYSVVKKLIQCHPLLDEPITMDKPTWALAMAFEHERIHLETSSVLIRELPVKFVKQPGTWPALHTIPVSQIHEPKTGEDFPDNELIEIAATNVALGKPSGWPTFGWDNEYGSEKRQVSAFKVSKYLVSNGEYFQFVKAGGYEQKKYWSASAWGWRQFRNVKWPTFWVQDGPAGSHRYKLRSLFSEMPMQWRWPAIVNHYEAKAYCAWLTDRDEAEQAYRLLQEAEHQAIRAPELQHAGAWRIGDKEKLCLDQVMNDNAGHCINHNLRFGSESAVDALAANEVGIYDVFGNVWQWCEDPFRPLQQFEIHPYYTDFSTPCFDEAHQMILGGSFISTGDEASIWARFHFRAHFFQHAGFRVVQDVAVVTDHSLKYETNELVNQYLLFHWGTESEQRDETLSSRIGHPEASNLILRTVELMQQYSTRHTSALDLGCAVGRASFELSRNFSQVTGIDYSAVFIAAAEQLRHTGESNYQRWETGRHSTQLTAHVADEIDRERIRFVQGDAANLDAVETLRHTARFDAILLSNLMCRLAEPEKCLSQFVETDKYLGSGGILVIASPNSWLAQFTDADKFLDGADSDETLSAIGGVLSGFSLLHEEDVPFMIREHRRKYEYIVSQVSVWKKV